MSHNNKYERYYKYCQLYNNQLPTCVQKEKKYQKKYFNTYALSVNTYI